MAEAAVPAGRRTAEQVQQHRNQQAADQYLHGDEVEREGDDVEELEEPDGGWQGDGINVRKTIHSVKPFQAQSNFNELRPCWRQAAENIWARKPNAMRPIGAQLSVSTAVSKSTAGSRSTDQSNFIQTQLGYRRKKRASVTGITRDRNEQW